MDLTEDDVRTAKLATELLADQGRPELSVTPEQLVRWRQVGDAIPVEGPRRGGRGQRVQYLPAAPAAAAAIAVALDIDRNLDRAVLAAFGNGAPIAHGGARARVAHYLQDVENRAREAYSKQDVARSEIPRKFRVPMKGSRRGGAWLQSDAMFALVLGEEPAAAQYGPGLALETVAPDAKATLAPDNNRRIEFVMRRLSLAALRRVARHVDVDHWREACGWVTTILDYGNALAELVELTGSDVSAIPGPLTPLVPVVRLLNQQNTSTKYAPGFRTAILGLVGAAVTSTRRRSRSTRETAATCQVETPKLRAIADLARELPEEWRPALALGSGPLFLAQLPAAERELAIDHTRQWMRQHPAQASLVLPPDQARELAARST